MIDISSSDEVLAQSVPGVLRSGRSATSDTSSKRDFPESPSQVVLTQKCSRVTPESDGKLKTDPRGVDLGGKTVLEGTSIAELIPSALGKVSGLPQRRERGLKTR